MQLFGGLTTAHINGMYIEVGTELTDNVPNNPGDYFLNKKRTVESGVARIAVTGATVQKDGSILFTGMLTASDFKDVVLTDKSVLTTSALVHMDESNSSKDIFAYVSNFKNEVHINAGSYITVNVGLKVD